MLIRKIAVIGRTYRQIERYAEILRVLFKFGFGDLVTSMKVERYLDIGRQMFLRQKKEKLETLSRAERVRGVVEELGPTFIKLGQMLSTRPDFLPKEFIDELVKLQDEVPAFPFEEARAIIERELRGPLEEVYEWVDEKPLAAASIGQVHRARLHNGEEVVIKVQRPGIREVIEVDLEILLHLATLAERHVEGWEVHRPTAVVAEFGRSLERELDYGVESANMERFAAIYQFDPLVYVPRVYRRAGTSRVLTMEFVDGIQAGEIEELRRAGYDLARIADLGARMVMEQTLVHGFFHADPHPGNLMVLPGPVICMLDMGMTGRLDRATREKIVKLVLAVVRRDAPGLVNVLLKLTEWDEEPDRKALEREAYGFMDLYLGRPLKEIELGSFLQKVFDLAFTHRLRVPPDLLLLIKALTSTEGLGRQLDPEFDIVTKAEPFVKRVMLERYGPPRLAADAKDYGLEILEIVKDAPSDYKTLMRLAKTGNLTFQVAQKDLEQQRVAQDRISNRLVFAIVLAALLVGSSIIIQAGIPPTWHGIPVIGLIMFVVAGLMGFWLLISILRRGML